MRKRLFDLVFSSVFLILFLPLFVVIAFLITIASPGAIFYTCKRVGKDGRLFNCFKFRTMYADAEERLQLLLASNREIKQEWELYWKLRSDPRITSIGKFLRKTSLDELPQLFNVLMGDLSLVGPRPVTQEEIEKYYGDKAEKILSLRPGITGLWQTSGRNLLTYEERIKLEERYVDTRTFLMDLKLIAKTVPVILFPRGAF